MIETTSERTGYFGVVLTNFEAAVFAERLVSGDEYQSLSGGARFK